jgi:hypothetical protein
VFTKPIEDVLSGIERSSRRISRNILGNTIDNSMFLIAAAEGVAMVPRVQSLKFWSSGMARFLIDLA